MMIMISSLFSFRLTNILKIPIADWSQVSSEELSKDVFKEENPREIHEDAEARAYLAINNSSDG
jgi:hypothetical protein